MEAVIRRPRADDKNRITLEEAFPVVDPLMKPLGSAVLVQMRKAKRVSAGGILLPGETQDWDASKTRVGKVIAMGPLAYKKRDSLEPWPEGAWVKVGDFVRVPLHAGIDGWKISVGVFKDHSGTDRHDWVQFNTFNDHDIKQLIKGDPLDVVDYV